MVALLHNSAAPLLNERIQRTYRVNLAWATELHISQSIPDYIPFSNFVSKFSNLQTQDAANEKISLYYVKELDHYFKSGGTTRELTNLARATTNIRDYAHAKYFFEYKFNSLHFKNPKYTKDYAFTRAQIAKNKDIIFSLMSKDNLKKPGLYKLLTLLCDINIFKYSYFLENFTPKQRIKFNLNLPSIVGAGTIFLIAAINKNIRQSTHN